MTSPTILKSGNDRCWANLNKKNDRLYIFFSSFQCWKKMINTIINYLADYYDQKYVDEHLRNNIGLVQCFSTSFKSRNLSSNLNVQNRTIYSIFRQPRKKMAEPRLISTSLEDSILVSHSSI